MDPGTAMPPMAEAPGVLDDAPRPLSPKALVLWRLGWVAGVLVVLLPVVGWALVADVPAAARIAVPVVVGVAGGAAAVVLPAAAYRRWRYQVTADGIELRHGLVVRVESSIPHFRVQHVDLRQGPLQRWQGVVALRISTASAASDAELPGVEPARAEAIRAVVLAHAEADDGV